jgi:hypothetical protein
MWRRFKSGSVSEWLCLRLRVCLPVKKVTAGASHSRHPMPYCICSKIAGATA